MIAPRFLFIVFLSATISCFSQDNLHSIRNILPINGDTVIAANLGKGAIVTYNAGKSWSYIETDKYFKSMTIDNNGVIWAIDSWVGIHEEDHSMLYKSADKGKTWQEIIFDTRKFFPLEIVSQPHQTFRISTYDKKEYLLNGNYFRMDWKFVGIQRKKNKEDAIIRGNYKLFNGRLNGKLLKKTVKWDTVYHFKDLYAYDMYIKKNIRHVKVFTGKKTEVIEEFGAESVYVAGFTSGGQGKAYFASLTGNNLCEYPIAGNSVFGIKEDNKGRLWVYNSQGIYLLKTAGELVKVF